VHCGISIGGIQSRPLTPWVRIYTLCAGPVIPVRYPQPPLLYDIARHSFCPPTVTHTCPQVLILCELVIMRLYPLPRPVRPLIPVVFVIYCDHI